MPVVCVRDPLGQHPRNSPGPGRHSWRGNAASVPRRGLRGDFHGARVAAALQARGVGPGARRRARARAALPLPGSQPSSYIVRREHDRAANLAQTALGMLSCGSRDGHRQRGSAPFDTPMLSGLLATYFTPAGGSDEQGRPNGQHEHRSRLQNGWRSPRHVLLRH